jgi:hypothetical protein
MTGLLELFLVESSASLSLEGLACLAVRRRQADTTKQVLPFQDVGGVHDRHLYGSWICTALVELAATYMDGGAQLSDQEQLFSMCYNLNKGAVSDEFREHCYLWHHRWSSHELDPGMVLVLVRVLELRSELLTPALLPFVALLRVDLSHVEAAPGKLLTKLGTMWDRRL